MRSAPLESGCRGKGNNLELRPVVFIISPIVPKEKELVERLRERIHQRSLVAPDLSEGVAIAPIH
jgi:hypothetical protein